MGDLFCTIDPKLGQHLVKNNIDGSNFRQFTRKKFLKITQLDVVDNYLVGTKLHAIRFWKKLSSKPNKNKSF